MQVDMEAAITAASPGRNRGKQEIRITRARAYWATLNFQRRHDPVMNMVYTLRARGVTHKWKQFALQVNSVAGNKAKRWPSVAGDSPEVLRRV